MRLLGLFFISIFSMLAFTVPAPAAPGSVGPSSQLVSCGNGVVEPGEDCDDGNTAPGDCCAPTCQFESASTECRPAVGVCDAPDNCDGAGTCTPDAKLTSVCRDAAGICDALEFCDSVSDDCPPDLFIPHGVLCRHPAHVCDYWRVCLGGGPDDCSTAIFPPPGTVCRASSGLCDIAESCDGVAVECPADAYQPPTTECRGAAGLCDAVEYCDGASTGCPPDEKLAIMTVCRPAVHICDAAEFCDGVSDNCPIIDLPANGLACPDGDLCNGDEICVGWVCTPGEPLVCDDEWACTADSCDPELGCVYEPIQGPGCVDNWLPSSSPTGRLLLSLLLVAAGATFLARRGRFGA